MTVCHRPPEVVVGRVEASESRVEGLEPRVVRSYSPPGPGPYPGWAGAATQPVAPNCSTRTTSSRTPTSPSSRVAYDAKPTEPQT